MHKKAKERKEKLKKALQEKERKIRNLIKRVFGKSNKNKEQINLRCRNIEECIQIICQEKA